MKERAFNASHDEVRAILAGATVLRRLLRVQLDGKVWDEFPAEVANG